MNGLPFFPQPHPEPRPVSKRQQKLAKARAWREISKAIKTRDKFACRACGARWTPDNPVDVHHRKLRSAGGDESTANLLCLCRCCHGLVHAYRLFILGDSADGRLRFERA